MLILAIGLGSAFGQARLKRANTLMASLDYMGAIAEYNKILEKTDNAEAKIKIAECYRKVSDSENAEYWYGQVVRLPEVEPEHKLFYGQALQKNGKCDLAREWFEQYVEDVPDDLRGQYLVKACNYEEEIMTKNAGIYELKHLEINSAFDDFSPVYYGEGIVFATERDQGSAIKRQHSWTGAPFLELFYVKAKEESGEECGNWTYGTPKKFADNDLNSKFHDAAVAFSDDESQVLFTRNNILKGKVEKSDDGTIKLKVFTAESKGDNKWGDLVGLPFNSDEYSVAHPTLTPGEEKLYFSSDMPGGFGGMDLYYSEKDGGNWGPPINLGPSINTEGNEVFPFYEKSGRLYFSTDGHIGLGGLDVYYMEDKGEGEFGPIENMGYPINTVSDDFGIVFNEEATCGHISSDRDGGSGGDDIYSFKKTASPVQIFVYDKVTGDPIEGATVLDDCTGEMLTTGVDGKVTLDMKMNLCCNFTAMADEYMENVKEGCTKDIPVGERVFVEIPMEKDQQFDIEGVVFDQSSGLPLEGATVTLTNDCGKEEQTYTTDATGTYTFKLDEECCYIVKGELADYLADKAEECTRDLEESTTLQVNLNLQPTKVNDYVINGNNNPSTVGEFDPKTGSETDFELGPGQDNVGEPIAFLLHIYYDFNQAYIRSEDESDLEQLYTTLVDNSEYVVEISSHTDARGSHAYNQRLSQRRAESVIRWLSERGIDRQRLVAKGHGETKNVNDCVNNIPCSELEHQLNRRTEFRILGTMGDVFRESAAKPDPTVVPCQGCPF